MENKTITTSVAIKTRRQELGLTNDDSLAKATGAHQTTVSRWGRGTGYPSTDRHLRGLARWLGWQLKDVEAMVVRDRNAEGLRRPRVLAAGVPGTPEAFEQLSAAVARIGKQVSALNLRVDDLAEQVAAQSPRPGQASDRRRSPK